MPPSSRRKASSSPGSPPASLSLPRLLPRRSLGDPARAQLPDFRASCRCVGGPRAAARRACGRDAAARLCARLRDRRHLFHRHALLDHPRNGGVRRPAARRGYARQRAADRLPRAVPGALRFAGTAADRLLRPARAAGGTARVDQHRAGPDVPPDGFSMGAARVQPGRGPAGCPGGQPVRCLRPVGSRRCGQCGDCVRCRCQSGSA